MNYEKEIELRIILLFIISIRTTYVLTKSIEKSAAIAIVGMYLFSAIDKFLTNSDVNRLISKWKIKDNQKRYKQFVKLIVFVGGMWELLSSVALITSVFTNKKKLFGFDVSKIRFYSVVSLILFTIAATLMVYVFPFRPLPIMSNINAVGGLLAFLK